MLINALFFNVSWFGLILFGNAFLPVTLAWLSWHIYQCRHKKDEFFLIVLITLVGIVIDSLLMHLTVFSFSSHSYVIPLWLLGIWASFAAIFPADSPEYVVLIVLDSPKAGENRGRTAAWNAAPTAGRVIERIAPILEVEPRFDEPVRSTPRVRSVADRRGTTL